MCFVYNLKNLSSPSRTDRNYIGSYLEGAFNCWEPLRNLYIALVSCSSYDFFLLNTLVPFDSRVLALTIVELVLKGTEGTYPKGSIDSASYSMKLTGCIYPSAMREALIAEYFSPKN